MSPGWEYLYQFKNWHSKSYLTNLNQFAILLQRHALFIINIKMIWRKEPIFLASFVDLTRDGIRIVLEKNIKIIESCSQKNELSLQNILEFDHFCRSKRNFGCLPLIIVITCTFFYSDNLRSKIELKRTVFFFSVAQRKNLIFCHHPLNICF